MACAAWVVDATHGQEECTTLIDIVHPRNPTRRLSGLSSMPTHCTGHQPPRRLPTAAYAGPGQRSGTAQASGPPAQPAHAYRSPTERRRKPRTHPPIRADPRASAIINLRVQSRAICAHCTVAHAVGHLVTCR
jgi:hypothetical protein